MCTFGPWSVITAKDVEMGGGHMLFLTVIHECVIIVALTVVHIIAVRTLRVAV